MQKAVIMRSQLIVEGLQRGGFRYRAIFLTDTYRNIDDYRPGHRAELNRHIREYLRRRGHVYRYEWVHELQARGAVHGHTVIFVPRGVTLPKPDKRGWWPYGSTRIEWARNPVGYMAKYASKGRSVGKFPRGLRLHGGGGLDANSKLLAAHWMLPPYAKAKFAPEDKARRAPGGGWFSPVSGEVLPSPWRLISHGVGWEWVDVGKGVFVNAACA